MTTTHIIVKTARYEASHGHAPRQPRGQAYSGWAFQIDDDPTPVYINNTYTEAVAQAKYRARHSVTVLP